MYSSYPRLDNRENKPIFVETLAELDADTSGRAFLWDSSTGFLYLKLMSNETRTNPDENCVGDKCPKIYIYRKDGGTEPTSCDATVTPYDDGQSPPAVPQVKSCSSTAPDSPLGLGALRPEDFTAALKTQITCPVIEPPARGVQELRGCFLESQRLPDFNNAMIKLFLSLTPQVCMDRCFQRGFPYAAVSLGRMCQCSDYFGRHGPLSMSECNTVCPGDKSQTCGAIARNQVYTTGAALLVAPIRCGPGNRGVVYKDVCLYLSPVREEYPDAERRCSILGGVLTKIDTKEKQNTIVQYLFGITQNVWTGLQYKNGQWQFSDGTRLGQYSNWYPGHGSGSRTLVKLLANREFQWYEYSFFDKNMPLCDLPLVAAGTVEPSPDRCGVDNKGQRYDDAGACYALIQTKVTYDQARYWCYTMAGVLAKAESTEDKKSVEDFLRRYGVSKVNYWVNGKSSTSENAIMYNYANPRQQQEVAKSSEFSLICLLDEVRAIDKCPTDWVHHGKSCYLNKNDKEENVELVAAKCNSDRASVLSIDSQEENEFIRQLLPYSQVWLDLRYSSSVDNFMHSDGTISTFSNWIQGNPLTSLSSGICAQLNTASGTWHHKACYSGSAHVVCEMAALA